MIVGRTESVLRYGLWVYESTVGLGGVNGRLKEANTSLGES